jgi:hypothetical protein
MTVNTETTSGDPEVTLLISFLMANASDIGMRLAQRYRDEIVEYRSLPEGFIDHDVAPTARQNLEQMLQGQFDGDEDAPDGLDAFRESAIRRFRQGVSIQALLHAYRLWGHTVWEEVQKAPQVLEHPSAGLVIAGRIMRHVDRVSTAVAEAYLDEAAGLIHDREKGRRDLLEALIAGNQPVRMASYAHRFKLAMDAAYVVVLVRRRPGMGVPEVSLRTCLETVQRSFQDGRIRSALMGTRDEEVVALIEAESISPLQIRPKLDELASTLPEFLIATSRRRQGLGEISEGYTDAQSAVTFAMENPTSRAYLFSDTLLDQIARSSDFRVDLLDETTHVLADYDLKRHTELLPTIKAYVQSDYKLTQAATLLRVQPNTVKYRLQRVAEVTGHDPFQVQGMTLFSLALRLPLGDSRP